MWENEKMEKLHWRRSEIIAFLESRIEDGSASEEEECLYQDYHYFNKLDRSSEVYRKLIHKMKRHWNGE